MSPRQKVSAEDPVQERLSFGSNGFGRERVSELQRARILSAMVEEAADRGAMNVTVAQVVARCGVSRRTFYEIFEDREDCFLAAFESGVQRVASEVSAQATAGRTHSAHEWREKIRAGLIALLSTFDREPALGRLLIVESLGAGPKALDRRGRVLDRLVAAIDEGRTEVNAQTGAEPPPLTAEGVVGAVLAVLHGRLLDCPPSVKGRSRTGEQNPGRLLDLVNPLMSMIVLPYLGPDAARRELHRPVSTVSDVSASSRHGATNPLCELEMRLTYRTVRVLTAVAENPGSSNRTVADASEVADQGQISKLLARLQVLGLVENQGHGTARRVRNAWRLTAKGREIARSIRSDTHPGNDS